MKKFLLLIMLVSLVACNQSEDDLSESQQWSSDTIPNPEDGDNDNRNNSQVKEDQNNSKMEQANPFKKEEIAGEWEVIMMATSKSCENKDIPTVVKERWFINFENDRLNITVMNKDSKTKQYWGYYEGKRLKAIADKKLTKQEIELLNENDTQRNSLNLEVNATNLINGLRVHLDEEKCRVDYSVTMKR